MRRYVEGVTGPLGNALMRGRDSRQVGRSGGMPMLVRSPQRYGDGWIDRQGAFPMGWPLSAHRYGGVAMN
eukprot:4403677-Pyramimonas_sp.AAC.2